MDSREPRPTHITIVGGSQHKFLVDVAPYLFEKNFSHLIEKIAPPPHARIQLSPSSKSADDLRPLLRFLQQFGIPEHHIRIHFPAVSPQQVLQRTLRLGLRESGLDFGFDVAEKDTGLSEYFIRTPSYLAIASNRRHIVIGPKGSGKTAILRNLTANQARTLVITPEHYATEILKALQTQDSAGELGAFITTWKYTLLVEIFRQLVQNRIGDSRAQQQLRSYLIAHGHLSSDLTLLERFLGYLRRIRNVKGKLGPVEVGVDTKDSQELGNLFKMGELLDLLPSLRAILRRVPFAVYIDELDQSWDNSETANRFLVSLLTAAIQLQGVDGNLHVVVFLRTEIFELLKPHLPQLDKLRSDIETLIWTERELANLIASRTIFSWGLAQDLPADAIIRTLFPGKIDGSDSEIFSYLLTRTSLRPREVIQFCNLALDIAVRSGYPALTAEAVLQAEEVFSSWRRDHILSENLHIYPRLDSLLERFRGKSLQWDYRSLDNLLADVLLECQGDNSTPSWLREIGEPVELLRLLYTLEVIGIERQRKVAFDSRRLWEEYEFAYTRPKGKPEQSSSFLIHPGLWKALELF